MLRRFCFRFLMASFIASLGNVAHSGETRLGEHTFKLPDGFEIELVAGTPLVDRPITADFDEEGRLYVADSSGSNDNVQKQLAEKPHRIVRLEDTNQDGRFDHQTVFADKMMFPAGTLWHDGSLYVTAPPSIWKLTDTDGDGVAEQREEWFKGKTLTGCANDLHGPYLGRDGWIYWCKGAFAEQRYTLPTGKPFVTRAAHIFRAGPDGSDIEPVMTGGMDNPVDVAFTPGGERIFTTTFLQHPGGGNRDGLIHAIYGGVYGKIHDVIDGHPRTSPDVMPVLCHLGAAAPSGLTSYESKVFGDEYQGNLFAALFNLQRITRHVLKESGATFSTEPINFVVSDNKDFHPTDVLEDADGSLLIVDTGGWYKLCCPTSQLVKPDVLGAIYRVRRTGAKGPADPWGKELGRSLSAGQLIDLLDDPRPAVVKRAIHELAARHTAPIESLRRVIASGKSRDARLAAVWSVTRLEGPEARTVVRQALGDTDSTVRQAAIHSASVWRDATSLAPLQNILTNDASLANRRAAAEAIGRIGDPASIESLVSALQTADDPVLAHSITYALIEIGKAEPIIASFAHLQPRAFRAALTAVDQMPGSQLDAKRVIAQLESIDEELQQTSLWILSRHAEWGEAAVDYFQRRMAAVGSQPAQDEQLAAQLAKLASSKAIQSLLARELQSGVAAHQEIALRAMEQARLPDPPAEWNRAVSDVLGKNERSLSLAIRTAKALLKPNGDAGPLPKALQKIVEAENIASDARIMALGAVSHGTASIDDNLLKLILDELTGETMDHAADRRSQAAEAIARARLTKDQLLSLTPSLSETGPVQIEQVVTAFAQNSDNEVGEALLAALADSPALPAVRSEVLTSSLARCNEDLRRRADGLLKSRTQTTEEQARQLAEMLASLPAGDVRRGQSVFNGSRAACTACHAIGYLGGKLGPDLTKIGEVRTDRDLLESILFPSASFVRSYEPVAVLRLDGTTVSGLVRSETAQELRIAISATDEQRIPRSEIEELRVGTTSIMPAGLEKQLSLQELADLVAFLKACR